MGNLSPAGNSDLFLRPILTASIIAAVFLFVWYQFDFLLLTFSGILVAVWLRALTAWLQRKTPLTCAVSYLCVLVLVAGGTFLCGYLVIPTLVSRLSQIGNSLPTSIHKLEGPMLGTSWGPEVIAKAKQITIMATQDINYRQLSSNAVEGMAKLVVIVVVGFFASMNPRGYESGVLVLLPDRYRGRAIYVASELQQRLSWWFLGQVCIMAALGISCGLSLWFLKVPLAGTLGLITGLAVFLPYVGTVTAGIPSVLMALQRGPNTAIYVLLVYTGLHVLEGYVLTPLVQQRAVRLPPVITVLTQFLLWKLAGIIGVAVAAPLATVVIVLIKLLWLRVPSDKPIVVQDGKV